MARQPHDKWRNNLRFKADVRADSRAFIDAGVNLYDPPRILVDRRPVYFFSRSLNVSTILLFSFTPFFLYVLTKKTLCFITLQGEPLVPQRMYENGPTRTWVLNPERRLEVAQCLSRPCPRHVPFRVQCGHPLDFYDDNGVHEDYRYRVGGVVVKVVSNHNP